MEKPIRQRIPYKKPEFAVPLIVDEIAFVKNKCSEKARKITTIRENLKLHIWFDKHYQDRHQFGEDNGDKREGIEPQVVEDLIVRSIKHLFFYSSTLMNFKFINLDSNNAIRINLRDTTHPVPLNVVIEVHYHELNEFEITVKTALCVSDFWKKQGRHTLEIDQETSILYRCDNGKFTKLGEY